MKKRKRRKKEEKEKEKEEETKEEKEAKFFAKKNYARVLLVLIVPLWELFLQKK